MGTDVANDPLDETCKELPQLHSRKTRNPIKKMVKGLE